MSIPDCEGISGAEIAKLVALELAPHFEVSEASELRAAMRCSGARAEIRVDDARRAEPLVLELSLSDARPEARPRLLALAIAELIATSRLEQPPPREATEKTVDSQPSAAGESEPGSELWLAAGLARELKPSTWAPAVAFGAAHSFGLIQLAADIGFDWSARRTSAADLSTRALSLALAPGLRLTLHPLSLSLGAGVRAGWAWLGATARETGLKGGSTSGLFLTPIAQLAGQWALSAHWRLRVAFELGYITKPVRGLDPDHARLIELSAWRSTGMLGVAWQP